MRWAWVVVLSLNVWVAYVYAQAATCNRAPLDTAAPKMPGSNNFTIEITGNPQRYIPGEVYTVSLLGWREEYSVKKFTGFLLLVEPSQVPLYVYGPQSVGAFQLFGDALTMHSKDCPNAITHTSSIPKSRIQAMWTAPPKHSGCVRFRATVVENRDVWYMDDGGLTKEICEEEGDDPHHVLPISQCCACDEAKYEVIFEGLWSRHTHPKDFPNNEWLTHFSDIIGASHSSDYMVWEKDKEASDGLKQVAEWGSTRMLESELKRQSDHIRTIIKARGLWYPNVNGKTFAVFRVDSKHHLMSLVSMLGPTPDWIVGVSALELCLSNCSWIAHKTLNLYPYDAGTDSGVTYESANNPTVPRGKVRPISSSYPNDPASPFYDPTGKPMKPLAKLTITRQRVYEKSCSETDLLENDDLPAYEVSDQDQDRMECQVSEWSQFSPCSATCGKGLRSRTRTYLMPQKAQMSMCKRQLEEKEMCAADLLYCPDSPTGDFSRLEHFDHRICAVSEWSPWTPCSATCGTGHRMRSRRYLDRMGRKKCDKELVAKEMCQADVPICNDQDTEIISDDCAVTQWSDFSPCSKTCGKGITMRTRSYLVATADHSHCNVNIRDERACMGHHSVCFDPREAKEICMQEKEVGVCRGYFERWYYDTREQKCMRFIYGGCRGNRNNFMHYDECSNLCESGVPTHSTDPNPTSPSRHRNNNNNHNNNNNCTVSSWSEWGPCSATCGRDVFKEKRRRIISSSPHSKCRRKLVRRRRCTKLPRCSSSDYFNGLEALNQRRDPEFYTTTTSAPVPYQPETEPVSLHGYDPDEEYISPNLYNPHVGPAYHTDDDRDYEGLPVNCVLGEWGPWSPCTHTCGPEALQQRSRLVIVEQRNGGARCGDTTQRRYCNLPPCPRIRSEHFPWLNRRS